MRRLGYQFIASHWMNWLMTCLQNNLLSTCLYVSLYTFYWLLSELHWAWLAIKPVQNTLVRETIVFIITCRREGTPSRQRTDVLIDFHSFFQLVCSCLLCNSPPSHRIGLKLSLSGFFVSEDWYHNEAIALPWKTPTTTTDEQSYRCWCRKSLHFFLESSMFCNLLYIFKRFSFNHRFTVPTL